MTRGWTSDHLTPVGNDDTLWTVADAARILGPLPNYPQNTPTTATETRIRLLADAFQIPAQGKRRTSPKGKPGRYARVYHAQDIIELYETLGTTSRNHSQVAA